MGRTGGLAQIPRAVPHLRPATYRRLTLADRSYIQAALSLVPPLGVRAISRELGVSPSTVSREIHAHQQEHWKVNHYDAEVAHYLAAAERGRERPGKLSDSRLRAEVVTRLNLKFSPQQVAGQLKRDVPDRPQMHVSHEAIYQALYMQGKGALRHELTVVKALRSGRTGRKPQSKLPRRSSRPWLDGARLSDRPAEVQDRAVPGH
ncbi:transposase [Leucobacter albus]|uniref:Transposase n=2 Tax=Leucobacter albus TaxID=272210 RepID=A0ABW3TKL9_9MICO